MFQAGLVTVLAGQEEGGPPACLAVSPEGTVRYWSSAAQEAAFVEVSHAPATPPATPPPRPVPPTISIVPFWILVFGLVFFFLFFLGRGSCPPWLLWLSFHVDCCFSVVLDCT